MSAETTGGDQQIQATLYLPNGDSQPIDYKASDADYAHMDMAIREAEIARDEGNVAIGSVFAAIIDGEDRTFPAHSTEVVDRDLYAHAEHNSYRGIQPFLGMDLSPVIASVTVEPCRSCLNLFIQGGVGQLHFAARYADVPGYLRPRSLDFDYMLRHAGRTMLVVEGIRKAESLKLLTPENKVH